jgi:hypothetical protein
VHLSDLAIEIIGRLPRFAGFVFSVTGEQPVEAYSDAKTAIDKRLAAILPGMEPWVMHDLRRTCTTGMAQLGIPPHIADKVLNHQSGVIRGVATVYNKFDYQGRARCVGRVCRPAGGCQYRGAARVADGVGRGIRSNPLLPYRTRLSGRSLPSPGGLVVRT